MTIAELEGKVVILTGASGGFGRVLTKAFVANKLRVGALDIDGEGAASLQKEYGDDAVLGLRVDVTDPVDVKRQVEAVKQRFGGLHMLVNNAALGMNSVSMTYNNGKLQIEDVSEDIWRRFTATNINGPFFMARQVVPVFRKQGWGRIVNITTSYLTMLRPGFTPYGPCKAAIESWSSILSAELKDSGITVNIVVPGGPSDTVMVPDEEGLDRSTLIPPAVMAPPIVGLFTEAGGAVTGQRFIAANWDESLGADPAKQEHRPVAWPELVQPFSKSPSQA